MENEVQSNQLNENLSEQKLDEINKTEQENKEAKWYALHTFSGYEQMAAENLKMTIENSNLQNRIFDIIIPTEEVIEEKKGKRVLVTRKTMPS